MAVSVTVDAEDVERFSRISEQWWDEKGKFRPLHQINPVRTHYLREQIITHFGLNTDSIRPFSGLTLLDIGCGGGLLCEPFVRMGAMVTGIDASEKNIKVASLHAEKMGLEIDYRATTPELVANKTPITQYDIVFALEIVEHVADVPLFLKSCAALVKPGGLLFMSTINRTLKSYGLAIIGAEYILRWLPRGTHEWHKFLKPSELCEGLRKENMVIDNMTGIAFNPLKNNWYLSQHDLAVNYMLTAKTCV